MIKLHGYFKDYAVIQADETVILRGECAPNSPVCATVQSARQKHTFRTVSDGDGNFTVDCGAYERGFAEYEIAVACNGESVTVSHVLFGDVFLALGQSNIELRLKYLQDYEGIIEEYGAENFRFLDVENVSVNYNGAGIFGMSSGAHDFCGDFAWGISSDAKRSAQTFGFSYIFLGEMQRKTGSPVAMINLAVGGSSYANWLPRETIAAHPVLSEAYARSLELADNGQSNAGCIYYEKIRPLKGFAFRGAVWYLGESMAWEGFDSASTILPASLALFELYRKELRGGLKTVIMDIGMQSYGNLYVNYANEQFGLACEKIKNLVECPLFDLSHEWIRADGNEMYHPIHLVEKRDHARRAAELFYENFIAQKPRKCPKIQSVEFGDAKAICTVANADSLTSADGKPLYGFALAESDGNFVTAHAEIVSGNQIAVSSPFVQNPKKLTYGFFDCNNLCNVANGRLPLLPYRSAVENAEGLAYAVFNPAFACRYEHVYENTFSALGGGAGCKPAHTAGKLFGDTKTKISYSDDGVTLSMRYCPQAACFAGISPEILISGQPHSLHRYDRLCLELTAERDLEFTGIHFRTCESEQFYLVPILNGKEQRNLVLKGGQRTVLCFDLNSAIDRKETTFALTREKRRLIAIMQITFRNRARKNAVTLHEITCCYGQSETAASGGENREKMYKYG